MTRRCRPGHRHRPQRLHTPHSPRRASPSLLLCALVGCALAWCEPPFARAQARQAHQAHQAHNQPAHVLGLASVGIPMRLTVDDALGQSRFAPVFGDVLLGYAFPGECLHHGFGLGVSWNFGHDGGYSEPVYAGDQIALMPSYLAYYTVSSDVFAIGHAGLPILVRGGPSMGFELGAALAYRILAGTGVFAALNLDGWAGRSFNVLASLQLGVVIDYEVLP